MRRAVVLGTHRRDGEAGCVDAGSLVLRARVGVQAAAELRADALGPQQAELPQALDGCGELLGGIERRGVLLHIGKKHLIQSIQLGFKRAGLEIIG